MSKEKNARPEGKDAVRKLIQTQPGAFLGTEQSKKIIWRQLRRHLHRLDCSPKRTKELDTLTLQTLDKYCMTPLYSMLLLRSLRFLHDCVCISDSNGFACNLLSQLLIFGESRQKKKYSASVSYRRWLKFKNYISKCQIADGQTTLSVRQRLAHHGIFISISTTTKCFTHLCKLGNAMKHSQARSFLEIWASVLVSKHILTLLLRSKDI